MNTRLSLLFSVLFAFFITGSTIAVAADTDDETEDNAPALSQIVSTTDATIVADENEDKQQTPSETDEKADEENGDGLSFSDEVALSTMNVDMLTGEKTSSRITIQPMVTISYGETYLNVKLTTEDLDKRLTRNDANRVDISVGMEKEFAGITFDGGVTFSDTQNSAGDFWCMYLTAEMEGVITPYIMLEVDIPTKSEVTEGGFLYRAGAKYTWQDVLFDLSIAGHDGAYGYKPQVFSSTRLSISKEFTLWGQKVTPELNVQKTFDNDGIAEDLMWVSVKFAF